MKMLKTIPVFILLLTGYLCNAQNDTTLGFSPAAEALTASSHWPVKTYTSGHFPGLFFKSLLPSNPESVLPSETSQPSLVAERSLPTLVVAGVSIALALLCILIVAIFWYGWKKSQEGSMVLNPIPYGAEAAVSLQNPSVPESQQGWPSERAVP